MSEPMTRHQVQLFAQNCALRARAIEGLLNGEKKHLHEWEDDCLQAAARDAAVLAKDLAYLANEVRRK